MGAAPPRGKLPQGFAVLDFLRQAGFVEPADPEKPVSDELPAVQHVLSEFAEKCRMAAEPTADRAPIAFGEPEDGGEAERPQRAACDRVVRNACELVEACKPAFRERAKTLCQTSNGKATGNGMMLAFDSTSISTYSNTIEIAEYGHAKQNPELKQVNLFLVCDERSGEAVYAYEMTRAA